MKLLHDCVTYRGLYLYAESHIEVYLDFKQGDPTWEGGAALGADSGPTRNHQKRS